MAQEFYIIRGSVNPVLRMEIINDGRYDFKKTLFNNVIQDSVVTFSMRNTESGLLKIAKANAEIVEAADAGCEERYILQYNWKERDVKEPGIYIGWFEIKFNGDIYEEGVEYPTGNLKIPIEEELLIYIK